MSPARSTVLERPVEGAATASFGAGRTTRSQAFRGILGIALGRYASRDRILGLDLLRVLAAFTILVYHGLHFGTLTALGQNPVLNRVYTFGYLAVDMFFVLSGWLLTKQILRMGGGLRQGSFAVFWSRRWLRTLPPYLVGLAVALWLLRPADGGRELALHAAFLQTIWPPNLYPVSWSLVTEEWFYLALPLAVAVAALGRRPVIVLVAALAILPIPMLVRMQMLQSQDFLQVLMTPQARFDGLIVGAGLAGLSIRAGDWYGVLHRHRLPLAVVALTVIAAILFGGRSSEASWLYRTFGLLLFSVAVGALIPQLAALRWPAMAPVAVIVSVTLLSDATYSLYLVHTLLPHTVGGVGAAVAWLGSVLLAALLLHLVVERPFLAIRSRLLKRGRGRGTSVAAIPAIGVEA